MLTAVVSAMVWLRPSQEDQIAAIRRQSNKYLVITRDIFLDSLAPWRARRESQGFQVVVGAWAAAPTIAEIKHWLKARIAKSNGQCRYIMLVGDCVGPHEASGDWHLPAFIGPMGYPYEMDEPAKPIVSDAPFGDIDDDGRMEVAVGRLPVRTISELTLQIAKIVQFEARRPEPSFYRAVLWTGAKDRHRPMYQTTLRFIDKMLPPWLYPFLISSFPLSVCSGPLTEQSEQFLSAVAQPALVSMVVGHGDYNNLRCAQINAQEVRMMVDSVAGLKSTAATGNLNVLTNFYLAGSLAKNINGPSATIGDLLMDSRQILYKVGKYTIGQIRAHDPRTHALLEPMRGDNQGIYDIKNLIRNERLLFNLLGDPCVALNKPLPLELRAEMVGQRQLRLFGASPPDANTLWVEQFDINRLKNYVPGAITDNARRQLFQEANQPPRLLSQQPLDGQPWQMDLDLKDRQMGYGCKIRVMAMGAQKCYYHTIDMPVNGR